MFKSMTKDEIKDRLAEIETLIDEKYTQMANVLPDEANITADELKEADPGNYDDVRTIYEDKCFNGDYDIVYYSRAIDFLRENDPSLQEAFEVAMNYDYQLKDLNSEILASLLNQSRIGDDMYACMESVNDICDEISDLLDEKEELENELEEDDD